MIIVSQGKTAHINYDNIEATYLLKKDDKIQINMRGNYDYTIGEYGTMERAKEVLQEIVKATIETRKSQELNNLFGGAGIIPSNTYYEMPED